MSNIKTSQIVDRQIPEYIRNEYPLFVDFIKAYYEFLNQTQAQELEKIKDINTTLDEFVDRFRNEIAGIVPLDGVQDPREFLRHIREFYKSRGSEASYKFLFRTLFGKEAELFYPSRQVLRASDGRWKQDISVFVKVDAASAINPDTNDQDLYNIAGKFVTITTSKKSFTTYVDRVVFYAGTVYEVFIQRDFSNEIEVGSTITFEDGGSVYSGTIQTCPSKISVFKAGAGFKPGDIFFLRTQKGRGCEIKITKVGSQGEIRAIQILSFGLDYDTRFFSYLSSKDDIAYEYFHPILSSNYNEKTEGFIESGYALKQTYLLYDGNYGASGSDNFFVEGDYVGEPITQFYTNDTESPIDEDIAIIDIQLGAVAKYPGYYETQDGFISDEIYIHDGYYYQAFSYVIRVEEQLEKYADIVKSILHPAGMQLFAEYEIFRELKVKFEEKKFFTLLQLSAPGEAPTEVFVSDSGLGTQYHLLKSGIESLIEILEDYPTTHIEKPFYGDLDPLSNTIKYTQKVLDSDFDLGFQYENYTLGKTFYSTATAVNGLIKVIEKPLYDTYSVNSLTAKHTQKVLYGDANVSFDYNYVIIKPFSANIITNFSYVYDISKVLQSSYSISDVTYKDIDKPFDEALQSDDDNIKATTKPIFDYIGLSDLLTKNILFKEKLDSITSSDISVKLVSKVESDSSSTIDDIVSAFGKSLISEANLDFVINSKQALKSLSSYSMIEDELIKYLDKQLDDQQITLEDYITIIRQFFLFSDMTIEDDSYSYIIKTVNDIISAASITSKHLDRSYIDSINNNDEGVLRFNPYDTGGYFVSTTTYQPSTALT